MAHPAYTDVSHFRAPYRNAAIGAVTSGGGGGSVQRFNAEQKKYMQALLGQMVVANVSIHEIVALHVTATPPELIAAAQASEEGREALKAQNALLYVEAMIKEGFYLIVPDCFVTTTDFNAQPQCSLIFLTQNKAKAHELAAPGNNMSIAAEPSSSVLWMVGLGLGAAVVGMAIVGGRKRR